MVVARLPRSFPILESDRLMLEDHHRREPETPLPGSRNGLDAEDRVPAQLEEIVVDSD